MSVLPIVLAPGDGDVLDFAPGELLVWKGTLATTGSFDQFELTAQPDTQGAPEHATPQWRSASTYSRAHSASGPARPSSSPRRGLRLRPAWHAAHLDQRRRDAVHDAADLRARAA